MKKRIITIIKCLPIVLSIYSGLAQNQTDPINVLEQTWGIFNTNYPNFENHKINWDIIYDIYRPKVKEDTNDTELFQILSRMLGHLNDSHVNLSNGKDNFNAGSIHDMTMQDFSDTLVKEKYLKGAFKSLSQDIYSYGWLNKHIAYIRIDKWKNEPQAGQMADSLLLELKAAKGLVIDVRNNPGGSGEAAKHFANRFADQRRFFSKEFVKKGPNHDSFFAPQFNYVYPTGLNQFTKPVVILQHKFSESASEIFIKAMGVLPHVTTIGEATSGAVGMYYPEQLSNGWKISMAWSYEADENDQTWAGSGLLPNLRVINTKEDIDNDRDKVLEFAMELVEKPITIKATNNGVLAHMPKSLYQIFKEVSEKEGPEAAVEECQRILKDKSNDVYVSVNEFKNGGRDYLQGRKVKELLALVEFAHSIWPEEIVFNWAAGFVYSQMGNAEKAISAYRKVINVEAYFPWDRAWQRQAQQYLAAN